MTCRYPYPYPIHIHISRISLLFLLKHHHDARSKAHFLERKLKECQRGGSVGVKVKMKEVYLERKDKKFNSRVLSTLLKECQNGEKGAV
jgi:hypothetical protein